MHLREHHLEWSGEGAASLRLECLSSFCHHRATTGVMISSFGAEREPMPLAALRACPLFGAREPHHLFSLGCKRMIHGLHGRAFTESRVRGKITPSLLRRAILLAILWFYGQTKNLGERGSVACCCGV